MSLMEQNLTKPRPGEGRRDLKKLDLLEIEEGISRVYFAISKSGSQISALSSANDLTLLTEEG